MNLRWAAVSGWVAFAILAIWALMGGDRGSDPDPGSEVSGAARAAELAEELRAERDAAARREAETRRIRSALEGRVETLERELAAATEKAAALDAEQLERLRGDTPILFRLNFAAGTSHIQHGRVF